LTDYFHPNSDHCGRNGAVVNATTASIKGMVLMINLAFLILTLIGMEAVVDYEFLKGRQNEVIVKEVSIAAKNVFHIFYFRSPFAMHRHGSAENGLNWDDGIVPYNQLENALSESVAGYAHL
jgi:hypothetical protein